MPSVHSRLGASGAYRWMVCPGSVPLSSIAPPEKQSYWAAEGTVAHAVCEASLSALVKGEKKHSPEYWRGMWGDQDGDLYETEEEARKAIGSSGYVFEVDDDMVAAVKNYHRYFVVNRRRLIKEYGETPQIHVEKQFDLSWIRPEMFGTNDGCFFIPGEKLISVDYKHGQGHLVDVENNPQLKYYALGALRELCYDKKKGAWDKDLLPKTVTLVVVQPRKKHKNGFVREWNISPYELIEDFAEELGKAADTARIGKSGKNYFDDRIDMTQYDIEEDFEFAAGGWCTFCQAYPICKAAQEKALTDSSNALQSIELDDLHELSDKECEAMGKKAALKIASEGPERLADLLKMEPFISAFFKSIAGFSKGEAERGVKVPGRKLVRGRAHRKWKDEKKAEEEMDMFLGDEAYKPKELKSIAQLEKLEGMRDVVDVLCYKPKGSLTLVEEDDSRPEVEVTPFDDMLNDEDDFL